jgi:uncharacterized membrane protein
MTGRYRLLIVVSLTIAGIAAVLPFGIASQKTLNYPSALEWVLGALALVAVVALVVELATTWDQPWPLGLTGFVWAATTVYLAIAPDATWLWHVAMALLAGGYAVLALTSWRLMVKEVGHE